MRKQFKSRFSAFNIPRRNEAVAKDTISSDTPAIDSGVTMPKFLLEKIPWFLMSILCILLNSLFILQRINIRFRGAMSKLISDYAQVEISN